MWTPVVNGKIPFSGRAGKTKAGVGNNSLWEESSLEDSVMVQGLSKVEDIEPLLYLGKKTPHGPMGRTEGSNATGFHDFRLWSNNRPAHTILPAQDAERVPEDAGMRLGVWGLH